MHYTDDTKEEIRQKIDIVDLVGRYVTLRRQGRMFVGLCPWHDDSKPSFNVNPERQSFKCWVCDIGGDIFSFIMKMEGVEFPEAKQILADMAGIELTVFVKKEGKGVASAKSRLERLDPSEAVQEYDPEADIPLSVPSDGVSGVPAGSGSSNGQMLYFPQTQIVVPQYEVFVPGMPPQPGMPYNNQYNINSQPNLYPQHPNGQLLPNGQLSSNGQLPPGGQLYFNGQQYTAGYVPGPMVPNNVTGGTFPGTGMNPSWEAGPSPTNSQSLQSSAVQSNRPVPAEPSASVQVPKADRTARKSFLEIMAWAESMYSDCLRLDPQAQGARQYLFERGLTEESISRFRLGFCPEGRNWLLNMAPDRKSASRLLTDVGIMAQGDYGSYDRFRDRVMYPIHDAMGRCIAFGGRIMPGSTLQSKAKYINSPETMLFTKRKQLYGLDEAKKTMSKSRRALVVEGYMDCIIAHQFGFTDTVAVLGTALGPGHIEILRHYIDTVYLVLDGDEAGQKRTGEVLELFVSQNMDLRVVTLPRSPAPDGSLPKDPADYLLAWGAESFADLVNNHSRGALEYAVETYTQGIDLINDEFRARQAFNKITELLAQIPLRSRSDSVLNNPDTLFREHQIVLKLAMMFRQNEDVIKRTIDDYRQQFKKRQSEMSKYRRDLETGENGFSTPDDETDFETSVGLSTDYPADWGIENAYEREMMELLFLFPVIWPTLNQQVQLEDLQYLPARSVYTWIQQWTWQGFEFSFGAMLSAMSDLRMKRWAEEVLESGRRKNIADPDPVLGELMITFRNYRIDQQRQQHLGMFQCPEDSNPQLRHQQWSQLLHQMRLRHGITDSMEGDGQDGIPEDPT